MQHSSHMTGNVVVMVLTRLKKLGLIYALAFMACLLLAVPFAYAEEDVANPAASSESVENGKSVDERSIIAPASYDELLESASATEALVAEPVLEPNAGAPGTGMAEQPEGTAAVSSELSGDAGMAEQCGRGALPSARSEGDNSGEALALEGNAADPSDVSLETQASTGYDSVHVNMYRLYNPNSGEHFYTSDIDEATSVASVGWQWEGIGWVAPAQNNSPVYRLYNPNAGDHHYTLNEAERDELVALGWNYEGIGWYSDSADQLPVYRQYNPNAVAGAHNFTTSADEDIYLGSVGWNREGTAWYATNGSIVPIEGRWLVTAAWGSTERYWIDTDGNIAKLRIISANEGAGYDAYATETGAVARGKYDGGDGYVYVADNDGRLAATADGADGWLVTDAYDGGMQRYYYVASKHAMHSGFFSIDGAKYFGIGGEGYVVRGTYVWGDHMLLADNDGHLATGTGWLETSLYDGAQERKYYLEYVWSDYSGAKLGLFQVDGKYYYGVYDGGYVGDSAETQWVNGWWYSIQNGQLIDVDPAMHARVNSFVELMKAMAADDSHGYDQIYRWGERGDYDCSSLVIYCLKQVGFDTGNASYTGNMRSNLVARGWEWRTSYGPEDLQAGVILLNEGHHTAAMISSTQIAQASINENGGISGGQPGDQTGKEVLVRDYYDYPWDGVLVPTPWCSLK